MKGKLLLFISLICFAGLKSFAQGYQETGARAASLSNSAVCLEDSWAYFHNPAAMTGVKSFTAGLYYDSRFLTRELQSQALVIAIPLKVGVLSTGAHFSGYEQYRSTRAGVGYSLLLGERFSAGVQANFQNLRFGGNYGSTSTGTAEAGLLAKVSEKWKVGVSIMNIGRQKLSPDSEDRYTSSLRAGALFQPSKKVFATMEVEKQVIHPVNFRAGIEYLPVEFLAFRVGAQTGPASFAFGLGYRKKGLFIDLGSNYHQILGWTPHIGITFQTERHAEK